MKILVLTNLYPPYDVGGDELRCATVTEALRQRGHDVHVLTSNHGAQGAPPAVEPYIDRSLCIHGCHGHPWLGLNDLKQIELHNNQTLSQALSILQPDVVHVWCMVGLSKSLCLTLQRNKVPTVYDVSDHWIFSSFTSDVWLDWWNRSKGSFASRIHRTLWTLCGVRARCDAIAPTSPVTDIRFDRLYFPSARLRELTAEQGYKVMHGGVIHRPVDTQHFRGTLVTRSPKNWLWVGHLTEDKGILTALRALLLIKNSFAGELHVYGKGDDVYVTVLKKFAAENSLPVTWQSATSAEMPAVYRAHDALLFTSECEEPFAAAPLEAMACGLPVIVTMTGGSSELFRNGRNAVTYDAGAATQLAECILLLQSDDHLRTSIAQAGQQQAHEHFAIAPIVDQIEAYLRASIST